MSASDKDWPGEENVWEDATDDNPGGEVRANTEVSRELARARPLDHEAEQLITRIVGAATIYERDKDPQDGLSLKKYIDDLLALIANERREADRAGRVNELSQWRDAYLNIAFGWLHNRLAQSLADDMTKRMNELKSMEDGK